MSNSMNLHQNLEISTTFPLNVYYLTLHFLKNLTLSLSRVSRYLHYEMSQPKNKLSASNKNQIKIWNFIKFKI